MRKIILSTNISLDGLMAGENGEMSWHAENWNEEMSKYAFEQLATMDTILAGRVTYQSMANSFSGQSDEFSAMMNGYQKVIFSKTLENAEWNNSVIVKENIPEEVARLKAQPGKDMVMWGGVGIAHTFIKLDLIDEFRLNVHPVVLGKGTPLFTDNNQTKLKLLDTKAFSSGVVLLIYSAA